MATTLSTLKIVAVQRSCEKPIAEIKRERLIERIGEQIEIATARSEGKIYSRTVNHKARDEESGETKVMQMLRYPKQWWWTGSDGKVYLNVRYGAKAIEFAKGKSAIEVGTTAALIPTLEKLKLAVQNSELDAVLGEHKVRTAKR
jgi:hypothetical protein